MTIRTGQSKWRPWALADGILISLPAVWHIQVTNYWINTGRTDLFLLLITVVALNVRVGCQLLIKRESPYLAAIAYIKIKRLA